ncbi:MAG: molecular chaperone DnaK [Candidatus Tagabacteria bacterium CG_4_10_14_0_2_um_filter_40_13]|uniref:Chaperone protein DnaK n=2 Tax=Candidatus Tagaibacteriota TaxID=1817918 RepID=A0A2M7B9W5_9BACT|nr:MAG: molecular chaperone DnaK [Candidatus Tagabacteria bacterium CG03_land_8_20_14_0_80_41_22]PIZ56063.1 MAG: molecular chaperone DnaK [Candidatus Tagabacteria bacterium CG_4_10_14_0_2_um_filter_40_13]PJC25209.1 MAG: molecular chaperone DnaK [Candidatus Tagabacteria bacterium CG_4_9_14_0_2_um_filter_41_11]
MSKILGIDLGTTNSAMAFIEAGEPRILENEEGGRTTPSIISISKAGDRLAGLLAKRQAVTNAENTIFSIKRLVGRLFTDAEVVKDKKWLPYKMRASASGGVEVKMGDSPAGGWYRPEEISAMVLQKLKHDAEAKLGQKIEEAIITVPAYFNDSQRKATKDAGEIAGFKVRRILNEPTAAALAYGFNKKKNEQIAVYDFGGGTLDISILEVGDEVIEVKATDGDTHLGGDDFDQKIIRWIVSEFKKESGIDISKDFLALQRLKDAAEKAKHELSSTFETEINIPFITSDSSGPKHLLLKFTRAKLEELVGEDIERSIEITKRALKSAKMEPSEIEEVILVGGQTRMPAIQQAVKNLFNREPNKSINPDEVVAVGAAVQGGILAGEVKDVLLLDVTPLSLGIETLGGVMTRLLEKNTTIPVSRSQVFSTAADGQTSVEIHVLQGEREMAQDNKTLGRFMLDGIPPSPRGLPQIEVTFDIDANGILNVKARDKATGKEQVIRIEASSGLTKNEIEKMKQDAQIHADEDRVKKESVEIKNAADALVYTSEKALRDAGDKVPADIKKTIEEKIEAVKKVKEGNDADAIKNATADLSREIQKIGELLYKQGSQQSQQPPQPPEDNIKDADYKEDDGDKK